jgi:hypothetical protein
MTSQEKFVLQNHRNPVGKSKSVIRGLNIEINPFEIAKTFTLEIVHVSY